eukprot:TRINITY_DN24187_c0_g1_i1.p1 TRINITY_DN24187_c0_g1~~TRINITY_DN24187_c0_g1_i1.p1  ORF type:complete len:361 (-),score=84.84 TRINITY_DN24187_c0_g1_i1:54-1136(-)
MERSLAKGRGVLNVTSHTLGYRDPVTSPREGRANLLDLVASPVAEEGEGSRDAKLLAENVSKEWKAAQRLQRMKIKETFKEDSLAKEKMRTSGLLSTSTHKEKQPPGEPKKDVAIPKDSKSTQNRNLSSAPSVVEPLASKAPVIQPIFSSELEKWKHLVDHEKLGEDRENIKTRNVHNLTAEFEIFENDFSKEIQIDPISTREGDEMQFEILKTEVTKMKYNFDTKVKNIEKLNYRGTLAEQAKLSKTFNQLRQKLINSPAALPASPLIPTSQGAYETYDVRRHKQNISTSLQEPTPDVLVPESTPEAQSQEKEETLLLESKTPEKTIPPVFVESDSDSADYTSFSEEDWEIDNDDSDKE